jgi:hypothetical protein
VCETEEERKIKVAVRNFRVAMASSNDKFHPCAAISLLDSKRICCLGKRFPKQQSTFLRWNYLCCTAKPFPVQEKPLLHSKIVSHAGKAFAAQQNRFPCRKSRCCTAKPFPVQEKPLLHSKVTSSRATCFMVRDMGESATVSSHNSQNSGAFGPARGIGIFSRRVRSSPVHK